MLIARATRIYPKIHVIPKFSVFGNKKHERNEKSSKFVYLFIFFFENLLKTNFPVQVTVQDHQQQQQLFTADQLALFDGSRPSKPVYLAILGRVFNVDKGRKHYGVGGGYHFFAGIFSGKFNRYTGKRNLLQVKTQQGHL